MEQIGTKPYLEHSRPHWREAFPRLGNGNLEVLAQGVKGNLLIYPPPFELNHKKTQALRAWVSNHQQWLCFYINYAYSFDWNKLNQIIHYLSTLSSLHILYIDIRHQTIASDFIGAQTFFFKANPTPIPAKLRPRRSKPSSGPEEGTLVTPRTSFSTQNCAVSSSDVLSLYAFT